MPGIGLRTGGLGAGSAPLKPAAIEIRSAGERITSLAHNGSITAHLTGDVAGHQPQDGNDIVIEKDGIATAVTITPAQLRAGTAVALSSLASGTSHTLRALRGTVSSQTFVLLADASANVAPPAVTQAIGSQTATASKGGVVTILSTEHFSGDALEYSATGLTYLGKGSDLYPQDSTVSDLLYFDASQVVTENVTVTATNSKGSASSTFTLTINAVAPYVWPASVVSTSVNRPSSVDGPGLLWKDDRPTGNAMTMQATNYTQNATTGIYSHRIGPNLSLSWPAAVWAGANDTATGTQEGTFNVAVTMKFDSPLSASGVVIGDANSNVGMFAVHGTAVYDQGHYTRRTVDNRITMGVPQSDGTLANGRTIIDGTTEQKELKQWLEGRNSSTYYTYVFRGLKVGDLQNVARYIGYRGTSSRINGNVVAQTVWKSTAGVTAGTADEKEIITMHHYAGRGELIDTSETNSGFKIAPLWIKNPTMNITSLVMRPGTSLSMTGGEAAPAKSGDAIPTISYQWKRDGVAIGGAIEAEYVLTDADVGKAMSVDSIATNENGVRTVTKLLSEVRTNPTIYSATAAASRFREEFKTRDFINKYGQQVGSSFTVEIVDNPTHAPFAGFGALRLTSTGLDTSGNTPGMVFLFQVRPLTPYTVILQKAGGTTGNITWKSRAGTTGNHTLNADISNSGGSSTEAMTYSFTTTTGQSELRLQIVSPSYGVSGGLWDWESLEIVNTSTSTNEIDRVAPNPVEGQGGIIPVPETPGIFYVDFAGGTDAGQDGKSKANPWKTAPVAVPPGSTVVLKGGVRYKRPLAPQISGQPGNPVVWNLTGIDPATGAAWGTGPAIVDPSFVLTPFSAGYALPNGATVYSAPAPTGFNHKSASLYDNDERLFLSQYPMGSDAYYQESRSNWLIPTANTTTTFTHPDLGTLHAVEPLTTNAHLLIHHSNNSVGTFDIASFDAATNTVTLTSPIKTNSSGVYKFCVMNHPSGMSKGGTFMKTGANIVVRPFGDAPMAGRLVTTQGQGPGFNFASLSHHTLKGGIMRKLKGGAILGEECSYVRAEGTQCYDINHGWGAINFFGGHNILVKDVHVENMLPNSDGDKASACSMRGTRDSLVIGSYFNRSQGSLLYLGNCTNVGLVNNYVGVRVGAHANSMTTYAGNQNCYLLGNEVRNDEGIALTTQNGDGNQTVAFNQFITLGGDQNRVAWHPDDIGRDLSNRLLSQDRDFFANNLHFGRDVGKNSVNFHGDQIEGMTLINNVWNAATVANAVDERTQITYGIEEIRIDVAGTGYKYLDTLRYTNGTGGSMEAVVLGVGVNGEITRIALKRRGSMTTEPDLTQKAFTSGSSAGKDANDDPIPFTGTGALFTPISTGRSAFALVSGNHYLRDFGPTSNYTPSAASAARNGDIRAWLEGDESRYFVNIAGNDIYAYDVRAGTADISSPGRFYPWTFDRTRIDPRWFPQFAVGGIYENGIPITWAGWCRPDGTPVVDWDTLQIAAV